MKCVSRFPDVLVEFFLTLEKVVFKLFYHNSIIKGWV